MEKNLFTRVLIEFIGTFIFLGVIVTSSAESLGNSGIEKAFAIGLALTVAILFGGNISGGYFNPAVSIMMLFNKDGKSKMRYGYVECILYIIAQVLGGICAYYFLR